MIRSNPTAIPLRANDVKLLQAEIDKRKAARESALASAAESSNAPAAGSHAHAHAHADAQGRKKPSSGSTTLGQGGGVNDERRTVAERIGL
ncbi:hypothetical protein IAU59_001965 [Kwoniella sp. CBS 9459]